MEITINTNIVYLSSWLELTETGFRGMGRIREYTRDGKLVRDETAPTGVLLAWSKPASLWDRIFG